MWGWRADGWAGGGLGKAGGLGRQSRQNWRAREGLGRPGSTQQNTQDWRGGGRGPGGHPNLNLANETLIRSNPQRGMEGWRAGVGGLEMESWRAGVLVPYFQGLVLGFV